MTQTPKRSAGAAVPRCNAPLQTLLIENLLADSLLLNPKNPRLHSDKQIRQIANSIKAFGFNVPVLVDAGLQVIAGHGRLLASQLFGMTHVPVIRLEHLSEHQRRAFMIADNRLAQNAEWDSRLLGEQFRILSEAEIEFSLEATGFEMGEIDIVIEDLAPASRGKDDPADAIPDSGAKPQVTRAADLWVMGRHRVYCGDGRNDAAYSELMEGRRADMVFTDPPYNDPGNGDVTGFGKICHRGFAMVSGEMSESEFPNFLKSVLQEFQKERKTIPPKIVKSEMQRFDFPRVVIIKPQKFVVL
jgi:hypothetical protein